MDRLATSHANGSIRLTTRQSFQFHGVIKWRLKETIAEINHTLLTTLAACGDVNRNVMCNPDPYQSAIHAEVYQCAVRLSEQLQPKTRAYHEIWLADEKVVDTQPDEEPLYGPVYLPRKFKVAVAVPPSNDVDVLAHDFGLIAIVEDGRLAGFNVTVGGGMGMTHGETATYPNLAVPLGFCTSQQILAVAEQVLMVQRDFGDRTNRKHARLKYTIADRGIEWFKGEVQNRLGWQLQAPRPYHFEHRGDRYGWVEGTDGKHHLTLFIENGRIRDWEDYPLMSGLRAIAQEHDGDIRLTANQNLIVGNVSAARRGAIERLVQEYKLSDGLRNSALRRNAMACVALPTCGLAMAESERYLPKLLGKLEKILAEIGLADEEIVIRMTGCPNGCAGRFWPRSVSSARPWGDTISTWAADFAGQRLNQLYRENIDEAEILATLVPILQRFAAERLSGERFGDFVVRAGYVRAVTSGQEFHILPVHAK